MKKGIKFLLVLFGIILVAGVWFVQGLNHAVRLDEQVKSTWAQVENQLQRRYDLIPNLVNTVKGYAQQEKDIFTEVTRLRSQWGEARTVNEKVAAANEISSVVSRLLLVAENYPQLKSNENFLALQSQLEGTENRISVERMRYNHAVQEFNTYRRTVCGSLFASFRGLNEPAAYFQAAETAKQVPQVNF